MKSWLSLQTIRSRASKGHQGVDNYHTEDPHTKKPKLMYLRRVDGLAPTTSKSKVIHITMYPLENFMTLKQACSSEYQRAQGAFKDSMIH